MKQNRSNFLKNVSNFYLRDTEATFVWLIKKGQWKQLSQCDQWRHSCRTHFKKFHGKLIMLMSISTKQIQKSWKAIFLLIHYNKCIYIKEDASRHKQLEYIALIYILKSSSIWMKIKSKRKKKIEYWRCRSMKQQVFSSFIRSFSKKTDFHISFTFWFLHLFTLLILYSIMCLRSFSI